jgi:hypothetical protein
MWDLYAHLSGVKVPHSQQTAGRGAGRGQRETASTSTAAPKSQYVA